MGGFRKEKLPINEECTFPSCLSLCNFESWNRPGWAISRRGVWPKGHDDTNVYPYWTKKGDVFAESTFAKQIAMIEADLIPPVIKVGNLSSLRTWSDVRDAVRAYYLLVTVIPLPGEYYNIGGT